MNTKQKPPAFQRRWRTTYWVGFGVSAWLASYAIFGLLVGAAALTGVVATLLGCIALLLGGVMATLLSRSGVSDMWFVKGTTTMRTVAIGWLALAVSGFLGALVSVLANVDFEIVDTAGGILDAIGAVALLAVVGPGYSEYREALSTATLAQ